MHIFYYLLRYIGKGIKGNIKKLQITNENNKIVKTHLNRTLIESKIIIFNI